MDGASTWKKSELVSVLWRFLGLFLPSILAWDLQTRKLSLRQYMFGCNLGYHFPFTIQLCTSLHINPYYCTKILLISEAKSWQLQKKRQVQNYQFMVVHGATGCLWHAYTATHLLTIHCTRGTEVIINFVSCLSIIMISAWPSFGFWIAVRCIRHQQQSSQHHWSWMGQVCCALKIPSTSILESRITIPELIFVCSNAALDPRFAAIHVIWQVFPELHGKHSANSFHLLDSTCLNHLQIQLESLLMFEGQGYSRERNMVTERTLVNWFSQVVRFLFWAQEAEKMSINICSGNVLGYKQATYQHNVQYVSLDNASQNVVICRFDLFTFASKTGYQTLIVGAISMIMQLVYPVFKPCTINLECFDKKCQHAPWLFHRVACVAASLSLCNILDSGLQFLLLWTWAGRQVEDDSATVLDKMTSSTAKISLSCLSILLSVSCGWVGYLGIDEKPLTGKIVGVKA